MKPDINKLNQKIQILERSFKKPKAWYTGQSIKKFIKKQIFDLQKNGFQNSPILAGRWSAYCHYSQKMAVENLLSKNYLQPGSKVLVHPLLPSQLIDLLVEKGYSLSFLDISSSTLNIPPKEIENLLASQPENDNFDMAIFYGFNGLYEEISESVKICADYQIPSLLVIDDYQMNTALLDLFQTQKLGSVVWDFGDSFWDDQLNLVLNEKLVSKPWFISWHLETRTRSLLEYHLSESHEKILPVILAYFYLVLEKLKTGSVFEKMQSIFGQNIWLRGRFQSSQHALNTIIEEYPKIFEMAICDPIFDLQLESPENQVNYGSVEQLIENTSRLQTRSKDLYDHFIINLNSVPSGTLEIPDFFLDKSYLKYTIYTTDKDFWIKEMSSYGFFSEGFPTLNKKILENQNLPNTQKFAKYGLLIDVWSGLIK